MLIGTKRMARNLTRVQPESNEAFDRRNEFKLGNILERMRASKSRQEARLRRVMKDNEEAG
jgi:hypothetical protein